MNFKLNYDTVGLIKSLLVTNLPSKGKYFSKFDKIYKSTQSILVYL